MWKSRRGVSVPEPSSTYSRVVSDDDNSLARTYIYTHLHTIFKVRVAQVYISRERESVIARALPYLSRAERFRDKATTGVTYYIIRIVIPVDDVEHSRASSLHALDGPGKAPASIAHRTTIPVSFVVNTLRYIPALIYTTALYSAAAAAAL